jgi:hypothetical protein
MEKRTREGGKMNYELPEYLASKVTFGNCYNLNKLKSSLE